MTKVVISDLFEIKLIFFTIRVEFCNFLNLYGRHVRRYEFLITDATDRVRFVAIKSAYFGPPPFIFREHSL